MQLRGRGGVLTQFGWVERIELTLTTYSMQRTTSSAGAALGSICRRRASSTDAACDGSSSSACSSCASAFEHARVGEKREAAHVTGRAEA